MFGSLSMVAALVATVVMSGPVTEAPPMQWRVMRVIDGVTGSSARGPDGTWGAAEGAVPADTDALLRHLLDFDHMPDVVPWLARTRVLATGPDEAWVYFLYDLPWPVADRDYAVRYRWSRLPSGDAQIVILEGDDGTQAPRGVVRVRDVRASFCLSPLSAGVTWVSYVAHAELGGLLPARVKEEAGWKIPLRTLLGLRRHFSAVPTGARP